MSISERDIEKGWIYKTPTNQERLVLGWDANDNVVYSSRGGGAMNEFKNSRKACSPTDFATACSEKIRQVPDVQKFIHDNNAQSVVVR